MFIRSATLADLSACMALDADSQTNHVWQMEEREENGGIAVRFQVVRLPRVMRVSYPRERDDLLACWENGSLVLVAADQPAVQIEEEWVPPPEGGEPPLVYGFCQADVHEWQKTMWINHLIVDRRFRRHSIGTALLSTCIKWARQKGLERTMVAVQTKNYPGIAFCQKHGFAFCGFNEHYFPNRDIAVLLALKI